MTGFATVHDFLNGLIPGDTSVLCPFHGDGSPSAKIYGDGGFHCFACGAHYTYPQLIAKIFYPDDNPIDAIRKAKSLIAYNLVGAKPISSAAYLNEIKQREVNVNPAVYRVMTRLMAEANEMFRQMEGLVHRVATERGLVDPVKLGLGYIQEGFDIDAFAHRISHEIFPELTAGSPSWITEMETALLGSGLIYAVKDDEPILPWSRRFRLWRHRLLVPEYRTDGIERTVIFYQARSTQAGSTVKYINPPKLPKPMYGWETLRLPNRRIWICEGAFDVLPLIEAGETAIATMGSDLKSSIMVDLMDQLDSRQVIVAYDNDDAGIAKGELLVTALIEGDVNATRLLPYRAFKDLSAWAAADGVNEIIAEADWRGLEK